MALSKCVVEFRCFPTLPSTARTRPNRRTRVSEAESPMSGTGLLGVPVAGDAIVFVEVEGSEVVL